MTLHSQAPISSSPERNAVKVPRCSADSLSWPQGTHVEGLLAPGALIVRGSLDGLYRPVEEVLTIQGTQVTFMPSCPFQPGEQVTVSVTAASGLTPVSFQFHCAAETHGQGFFSKIDEHALTPQGGSLGLGAEEWSIGLQAADLDGDHDVDLIVADRTQGQVLILQNDEGKGIFGVKQTLSVPGVLDVALVLNGTDPASASYDALVTRYCTVSMQAGCNVNEVLRLVNDGQGTFSLGEALGFNAPGAPPGRVQELTAIDVDQDGLDDLAVTFSWLGTAPADNGVALIRNVPGSGLAFMGQLAFDPSASPPFVEPRGIAAADLDADWIPDLAVACAGSLANQWSGAVTAAMGPLASQPAPIMVSASGARVLPFVIDLSTGQTAEGGALALRILDLDPPTSGPGYPDIMATYRALDAVVERGRTQLIYGDFQSPGTFGEIPIPDSSDLSTAVWRQRHLLVAEFEDTLLQWDLVVGGRPEARDPNNNLVVGDSPTLGLLAIDDQQPPFPPFSFPLQANFNMNPHGIADSPRAFAAADVDGDGDLDLLILADGVDPAGNHTVTLQVYSNGNTGPASVRFANEATSRGLSVHAYIQHPSPPASSPQTGKPGQPNEHGPGVAVADFDGDGIDDLFLPHETQEFRVSSSFGGYIEALRSHDASV